MGDREDMGDRGQWHNMNIVQYKHILVRWRRCQAHDHPTVSILFRDLDLFCVFFGSGPSGGWCGEETGRIWRMGVNDTIYIYM